jgi:hypothetical protein
MINIEERIPVGPQCVKKYPPTFRTVQNLPDGHAVVKVDNIFRAACNRLVNAQHHTHSLWTKSANPISAAATLTLLSPFMKFVSTANRTATSLNTGHTCWTAKTTNTVRSESCCALIKDVGLIFHEPQ